MIVDTVHARFGERHEKIFKIMDYYRPDALSVTQPTEANIQNNRITPGFLPSVAVQL